VRFSVCPSAAPEPWLFHYRGHYYQVVEDATRTWDDARKNAKSRIYRGWAVGYLAYLETHAENDDIGSLTSATSNDYWIGLRAPSWWKYKVLLIH
jgi:hypothetical protein